MSQEAAKVVLITGGSGGLGKPTAIEFAKLGCKVAISGFEEQEQLDKLIEEIASYSPTSNESSKENFLAICSNFKDSSQIDRVVELTIGKFGQLDILINAAGTIGRGSQLTKYILEPDFFDDFQHVLQVNLIALTRVCQLAAPHLIKTKGVIINVSSIADRWAMPTISYSVSKAGVSMLTRTLANALEGSGVRVLAIAPGAINTDLVPGIELFGLASSLNRLAEPKEIAEMLVFLSSDKAAYVHGSVIDIDGGTLAKFGGAFQHLREIATKAGKQT